MVLVFNPVSNVTCCYVSPKTLGALGKDYYLNLYISKFYISIYT